MSPESKHTEPVRSDPLAERLGTDEVLRPREAYRAALRDTLMRRPPVGPAPWQRLLPGPAPAAPLLVLLLALLGLIGMRLQGGEDLGVEPPAVATTDAAAQREDQPSAPEDPGSRDGEPARSAPVPDTARDMELESGEEAGAPASGPVATSLPPTPARAIAPVGEPSAVRPTEAPPAAPPPDEDDDEERLPPPSPTAQPSPTTEPEPTGIVYDDPTPGPTRTPPLASGRPTIVPPTPTNQP